MASEYTVTRAKNAGEKNNPHGGKLIKWYIDVEGPDGEVKDVYAQKKPGNDLNVGDKIYGRIEEGEYGPRFFGEQNPNGGGGSYGGGGGRKKDDLGPEFWAAKDKRIGRAGILQAVVSASELPKLVSGSPDHPPKELTEYLRYVNWVTDALVASLDAVTPPPNSSAPTTSASPPAQRSVEPAGVGSDQGRDDAASTSQKRALTIAFQRLGLTREAQAQIVERVAGKPASKAGASKLLDLVHDDNRSETDKLNTLCEWGGIENRAGEAPADTSDLDPEAVPF